MSHLETRAGGDANRATLERLFKAFESGDWEAVVADFSDDFVQAWPQSGERLTSKAACLAVYRGYPGGPPSIRLSRVSGDGDHWTVESEMHYGPALVRAVGIFEFRDGKIVRETDYFSDPFDPPAWRSQWVTVG
jgi:ketosteroid isomerase-like protein